MTKTWGAAAQWWRRRYTFGQYLLRRWLRLVHARRLLRLRWPRLAAMVLARWWWWWCGFWHRHRRLASTAAASR